uniref:Serpin domain-containing protein n=1 Tax=Pavo cristatus TaxID=9049 RepID=A0A8C9F704_PAVCR
SLLLPSSDLSTSLQLILDEDDYSDIIDAAPHIVSEIQQGNILELFQGKTRIQRLNILNANFGFNLYRSVADKANSSDNILMAPVGISTAMAMISLGLKGQTQQEVLSVLGFEDFVNASTKYELMTVHNLFRKLTHRLFRRNFDPPLFYFSQFNHQGTITVNEEGTEAGAITNVGFMPLSTQIRFIVDRPFLFLIYEHRTSCLLFMGRVVNPAKS